MSMLTGNSDPAANVDVMKAAFEALQRKDLDGCLALMRDDFKINIAGMPYQKTGHAAWRDNVRQMLDAFPDLTIRIDSLVASGDKVAVRVRFEGTQTGAFLGVPPSGRRIDYDSQELYRFEEGKLAEEWICSDTLTMLTQIGAISPRALILVWLGSFRLWLVAALGAAIGAGGVLLARALI